jgi:hypothetical protein
MMPTEWSQPYGVSRVLSYEYGNAEAGPSTFAPPPFPYIGRPTLQPSGGMTSETTTDAETNQTLTEEDKVTVSNFSVLMLLM